MTKRRTLRNGFTPTSCIKMFVLRRQLLATRLTTRLFSNNPLLCPSCHNPLPSNLPACTSCWSISPISPNTSHHFLFGLPYEPNPFSIHLPTLKERFRQAQAACHPDVWATGNPVSCSKVSLRVYSPYFIRANKISLIHSPPV